MPNLITEQTTDNSNIALSDAIPIILTDSTTPTDNQINRKLLVTKQTKKPRKIQKNSHRQQKTRKITKQRKKNNTIAEKLHDIHSMIVACGFQSNTMVEFTTGTFFLLKTSHLVKVKQMIVTVTIAQLKTFTPCRACRNEHKKLVVVKMAGTTTTSILITLQ